MINLGKHFNDTEVTKEQLQAINELLGIKRRVIIKEPERGESYYLLTGYGAITRDDWADLSFDINSYQLDNVFKTFEDAERERDKRMTLTAIKRDFIENSDEIDWKDQTQKKYYLYYDHISELVQISIRDVAQYGLGFFTTNLQWLKQYAKDNEEDIKKYYFGIKG